MADMETPASLGRFITERRERLGKSAASLAADAGLTPSHYSQIERGKIALPSADIRRRLAIALGVAHIDLLIAAGEITEQELPSTPVIAETRAAYDDPVGQIARKLREAGLTEDDLEGVDEMVDVLIRQAKRWRDD